MKKRIQNNVSDLISDFLYYDRKEDEDLPRGAIDQAIKDGIITEKEIVDQFAKELSEGLER